MPLKHGQKFYCQLLLDKHRYQLVEKLAEQQDKRVTALLRDMVYAALQMAFPLSEYKAAEAADLEAWVDSVKRRVEGRMRTKQISDVSDQSA